jgi:endoglucanase
LLALSLSLVGCDSGLFDQFLGNESSQDGLDQGAPDEATPDETTPDEDAPDETTPDEDAAAPSETKFYVDPSNSASQWAAANGGDPRAEVIAEKIGDVPIARWFGDWTQNVEAEVEAYVEGAEAEGAVPVLVAYNIPDRDCGQHSAGGAADFTQYEEWIEGLARGLGDGPAFVMLEPDSLALNGCAGSDRNVAIQDAVQTIKEECEACRVYLDAGHSNWVPPEEMAGRLQDAGILEADGIFSNVSNYNTTEAEQAFGESVLEALDGSGLGQVIDTSRNGNGPAPDSAWCDPEGRAVGVEPTTDTGYSHVDALLWVKVPGEADGCIAGAGQFVPDRAYELATS